MLFFYQYSQLIIQPMGFVCLVRSAGPPLDTEQVLACGELAQDFIDFSPSAR